MFTTPERNQQWRSHNPLQHADPTSCAPFPPPPHPRTLLMQVRATCIQYACIHTRTTENPLLTVIQNLELYSKSIPYTKLTGVWWCTRIAPIQIDPQVYGASNPRRAFSSSMHASLRMPTVDLTNESSCMMDNVHTPNWPLQYHSP